MRPYRIVDETLDEDEEYPRVVSIGSGGRARTTPFGGARRREPWTPRDGALPPASPRSSAPQPVAAARGFTRAHRWMIASFLIICVGMVLGMILVRVWDEASRAIAELPPEGSAATSRRPAPAPAAPAPVLPTDVTPAQGAGAVTTEIRVLQPNYTVAPGDTLGTIARRQGTNVDALAAINNLENRNSLSVGQRLIIP